MPNRGDIYIVDPHGPPNKTYKIQLFRQRSDGCAWYFIPIDPKEADWYSWDSLYKRHFISNEFIDSGIFVSSAKDIILHKPPMTRLEKIWQRIQEEK